MVLEGINNTKLTLESLFVDFHHPNPNINNRSVYLMIRHYPKESIERLINNFASSDLSLRRKSIKAITEFGEDAVIALLPVLYSQNNNSYSVSCLKALTLINAKNNSTVTLNEIPKIVELFSKEDDTLIILSLISLLRQLGINGLEYLITFSKDDNILKAKAAITAIGEIDDPRSESCLRNIIQNETIDNIIFDSATDSLNSKT